MTTHGTTSAYDAGCHCAECRAAKAAAGRAYRASRKAKPVELVAVPLLTSDGLAEIARRNREAR